MKRFLLGAQRRYSYGLRGAVHTVFAMPVSPARSA
jgi:hypothetical protein